MLKVFYSLLNHLPGFSVVRTARGKGWVLAIAYGGLGWLAVSLVRASITTTLVGLVTGLAIAVTTGLLLSAAVTERERLEKQLRSTLERDKLLAEVALRICQSLDLNTIFQTTVTEVRNLLHSDRVYIGFLETTGQFTVVAESLNQHYPSVLQNQAENARDEEVAHLLPQKTFIVDNIANFKGEPLLHDYYYRYSVKAVLAVPLMGKKGPIGLLVSHHCSCPRHWQKGEIRLLEQLAIQVAIAVQQAQLYQQVQVLNGNLTRQVQERTLELEDRMLELEDLHQMKAVFLQAVSHDLRTSMMGLLMLLKNLQNRSGENVTLSRPILDRLIQSGDHQLLLLNALSESHFAEHHPLMIQSQPLCLKTLFENLLADWHPLLQQNQAQIKHSIPDQFPFVLADPHYLRQVFENLLTNALKHNPPGIQLFLEVVIKGQMLRCTLRDNGVGMKKEQCQQLFGLYLRSAYNQRLTGIGLGCYQCRQIIEAHGGKIGVSSTPQQGTQFWFTLPLANIQRSAIS
jgi:signal transduction histidine kinase